MSEGYTFPTLHQCPKVPAWHKVARTCYAMLCVGLIGWAPNGWLEAPTECQHPTGHAVSCYSPGVPEGSNHEPAAFYSETIHETYGFYPNALAGRLTGKAGTDVA